MKACVYSNMSIPGEVLWVHSQSIKNKSYSYCGGTYLVPECAAIPGSFQNQGLVVQEIWVGPDETEISGACTVGILRLTVGLNVRHRWGRGRKAQHLSSFSRKACLLICR